MREWLLTLFDYDQWANRIWRETLQRNHCEGEPQRIMRHIMEAQLSWLRRLGIEIQAPAKGEIDPRDITERWKSVVQSRDLDEWVDYKDSKGNPYRRTVGQIALHVANHGTYHRGQIRGIVPIAFDAIPDTDLTYFFRSRDGGK